MSIFNKSAEEHLAWLPASRKNDPVTSHKSEAAISLGPRAVRSRQVLELVAKYPNCTTGELARFMHHDHPELPIASAVESPHKRVSDLEAIGLVDRGGIRKCSDTGRERLTWSITRKGERELER